MAAAGLSNIQQQQCRSRQERTEGGEEGKLPSEWQKFFSSIFLDKQLFIFKEIRTHWAALDESFFLHFKITDNNGNQFIS